MVLVERQYLETARLASFTRVPRLVKSALKKLTKVNYYDLVIEPAPPQPCVASPPIRLFFITLAYTASRQKNPETALAIRLAYAAVARMRTIRLRYCENLTLDS